LSQTSFGPISINSLMISMVLNGTQKPLGRPVGDQTAVKTKKIIACCSSPLGACSQGYCCQQKSLKMAVLFYIPQFLSSSRY